MSRWIPWLATGFGAGRFTPAPGTAGSLVGLALVFLLQGRLLLLYTTILLVVFALGVYTAGRMERSIGEKDCPRIVIDEIAGMLITAFLIPDGAGYVLAGFGLFRALDILKPFPANWAERRCPGGWGIMLDDAVAGIYANVILQGAGLILRST